MIAMKDIEERIARIRDDREHGSRWLVGETITLLDDLASDTATAPEDRMQQLSMAARTLAGARPAMAALAGAVAHIMSAASQGPEAVAQQAQQVRDRYDHAIEEITRHAQPLLHGTLLTDSISGTVLDVLAACAARIDEAIALEGRPRYEGRETAKALAQRGIAVTLITDAQADIFVPRCQAVVVGADSVLAGGDILNKAGTALVAWAARGHRVPFYVLCETLKIAPRRWTGDLGQLEEKEAEEVLEQPIAGVTARNFYFDRTPARLVTAIITEDGSLNRREISRRARELRRLLDNIEK
jgi:translation initiation factor 2B subunit (eIF-2B alpha/beta/delta family)